MPRRESYYQNTYHASPGVYRISGSFQPEGTGTPTVVGGDGFTVARTGVGEHRVTFNTGERFQTRISAGVCLEGTVNPAVDRAVLFQAGDASVNKLAQLDIHLQTLTAGAYVDTDLDSVAETDSSGAITVNFWAEFQDTRRTR